MKEIKTTGLKEKLTSIADEIYSLAAEFGFDLDFITGGFSDSMWYDYPTQIFFEESIGERIAQQEKLKLLSLDYSIEEADDKYHEVLSNFNEGLYNYEKIWVFLTAEEQNNLISDLIVTLCNMLGIMHDYLAERLQSLEWDEFNRKEEQIEAKILMCNKE